LVPGMAKVSTLTIVLGALVAVLLVIVLVFWGKVSARDTTIVEIQNRSGQLQTGASLLQAQTDEAKASGGHGSKTT